jgi:flagellar biosynthesis protein FliR
MPLYDLLIDKFELFIIILVRMMSLFVVFPFYGDRGTPMAAKAALALGMAYLVFPMVVVRDFALPTSLPGMVVAMAGETMVGLTMGFAVKLVLGAVDIAGSFIGFQMGFAIVNVVDPSGAQVSLIARFQELVGTMLIFGLSLDHLFIAGLFDSYKVVPPLGFHLTAGGLRFMIDQSVHMWVIAVKIAAPVMVALFAVNAAMGLIARSVPQMNVFVVGFPVTIGGGLILLGLTMPIFAQTFIRFIQGLSPVMDRILLLAR